MKYKAKQLSDGKYAVYANSKEYWPHLVADTEREARILALQQSARWYRDQADICHEVLIELGAVDFSDERGYLA